MERLLYISQGKNPDEHLKNIHTLLDSGCRWIQLRIKDLSEEELLPVALKAKKLCDEFDADLSINDHPAVAREVNAWGVHLGLQDMAVQQARKIAGPNVKIGGTVNSFEDVRNRVNEGVDYLGLGPLHFTDTKQLLSPILNHKGVNEVLDFMRRKNYKLPVIVVGGITEPDIIPLLKAGVYGVGISSLLTKANFPSELVVKIKKDIDEAINNSR